MLSFQSILERHGKKYVESLQDKLQTSKASGRLINSIEATASEDGLIIEGFSYFGAVTKGRGKTRNKTAGSPTLREAIRQWIDDKPITPQDISKDSLAFLIARKIHREGFKPTSPEALKIVDDPDLTLDLQEEISQHTADDIFEQISMIFP